MATSILRGATEVVSEQRIRMAVPVSGSPGSKDRRARVVLKFPAGAVSSDLLIIVTASDDSPADLGPVSGKAFDFEPDGVRFARPVQLEIQFDLEALPVGVTEHSLKLAKAIGSEWVVIDGSGILVDCN